MLRTASVNHDLTKVKRRIGQMLHSAATGGPEAESSRLTR
jgi:hypothetical protein